jgi:hypothetical protein
LGNEDPSLAFLTIDFEETYNSIKIAGKACGPDGSHRANLKTAAARLETNKIVYVRECQRLDTETTVWRPGLGEVIFDDSSDDIETGDGKFWESDESHPEASVIKRVELHRNRSDSDAITMRSGSEAEKRALVLAKLENW